MSETKRDDVSLTKLIKDMKEESGGLRRRYVVFLFQSNHSIPQLTSDIVIGLCFFDLDIIICAILEQAVY